MSLVQRFLGHPWVFEHVRPLAVGGVDMSPAYELLHTDARSVVLDIGCGTGDALRHLRQFGRYLGLDTDPVALRHARARHAQRSQVSFECRVTEPRDFQSSGVTHVCMIGLLHHLSDDEALGLLELVKSCPTLVRAVSLDIVYLPGHWYNNLMARFDRGRYCRTPSAYEALVQRAGLERESSRIVRSHPTRGLVDYFIMDLLR